MAVACQLRRADWAEASYIKLLHIPLVMWCLLSLEIQKLA